MLTKLHLLQVENQLENNNQKITLRRMRKAMQICIKSVLIRLQALTHRDEIFSAIFLCYTFLHVVPRRERAGRIYTRHAISIQEA